ncbi:hypothetical protein D030_2936B, partial [Vibrio parahaemolyticus AQ3810]
PDEIPAFQKLDLMVASA